MGQTKLLKSDEVDAFLRLASQEGLRGTLSCLQCGKWLVLDIVAAAYLDLGIQVQIQADRQAEPAIQKDQPVGVCFQHEQHKYIFETTVVESFGADAVRHITLERPDVIEKMPRRAYQRQPVPAGMNVRAMFWHRGHRNESECPPVEDYWQGKLENLSAGGAMIRVEPTHRDFFSMGQIVGLQFTPMSYQKPLLLEGHVRHLQTPPEQDALLVGVEFLGLEASPEGRDTLHRLLEVIEHYEKANNSN